ncbi:ATP-binding cassette domain-containing protein [Roseococcus sp. SDR]|uniref:ABC transporter transmembrane domain-containing protein n=1 Tax=Roseococcus sp. SDR TaxID=2835532 RepID=UPI001BCF1021|nr:ABC transporter transmembrane domain-containing protein [Roseococcus sp. SDR]MBS7789788.1 ATP-binding cassette domain-containing protein [Roseococcus sp. SDR]MBV1845102.1 ATP-binding cassette domain-containing protein [Roseococcus sp. SDR]
MSETARPRRSVASLRVILPYLRPYAWRTAAAAAALLVAAGLVLLLGQGLQRLIDQGFADRSAASLNSAAFFMFAVVAALGVATATRFYLVSWLGERVAADLRRAVFDHVISLSPSYFETARTGDILSRMTADIALLQSLIGSAISMGLRTALTATGALALLIMTSPKLAGIVVVVVPLVVGPLVLFGRRERRLSKAAQERVADLAATAEETLNGLRTVQAFTHEREDRRRFAREVEDSVRTALRRVASRAFLILIVILLGFGAITFSLWVGGQDVIAGRMTGGELSAFVFYAVLLASSGATISELWGEIQRAAAAADRLIEVIETQPSIAPPATPLPLPSPAQGRFAFEDVTFRYPTRPDTPALDRFSLDVRPGETVALVGPSGAGKTSVLQLLLRFYDPAEGRVTLDGLDLRDLDPMALRSRLALVPQDPVIFSLSAAENIRYGRPDASDAEVEAAARAAAAHDFIMALPEGYASSLGAKGVMLSGGQRQRIAIARAILRDPPILLLDEATSALDAESEQAVQQALARLAQGRTTLVVAHRLATVRRADRIVVMEAGRITAMGTHDALVAEGGLYARLAALQFDTD